MIFDILLHWLVYYLWLRLPFTFVFNWFYMLDKLRSDNVIKRFVILILTIQFWEHYSRKFDFGGLLGRIITGNGNNNIYGAVSNDSARGQEREMFFAFYCCCHALLPQNKSKNYTQLQSDCKNISKSKEAKISTIGLTFRLKECSVL